MMNDQPAISPASVSPFGRVRIASVARGTMRLGITGVIGIFAVAFEQSSVAHLFIDLNDSAVASGAFVIILLAAAAFGLTFFEGISVRCEFSSLLKRQSGIDAAPQMIKVLRSLKRIRVMAVLLMLVGIAPFLKPLALNYGYGRDGRLLAFWSGNQQVWAVTGLLLWILGCGWVLMLARRAVWDFWFAGGGSADGEVGRAFAVMMPSFPTGDSRPDQPSGPLIPMALAISPRAEVASEESPLAVQPVVAQEPNAASPLPPIASAVIAVPLPAEFDLLRAERSLSRYEQVLYLFLLACLIVCIFRLPATLPTAKLFSKPDTWRQVRETFESGSIFFSYSLAMSASSIDPLAGAMGVTIAATSLLIWAMQLVVIVWVIQCLLLGPRFLRAANISAASMLAMLVLRATLATYLAGQMRLDGLLSDRWPFSARSLSIPATLLECLLPTAALVLFRLSAVQTLFRVRAGSQQRNT